MSDKWAKEDSQPKKGDGWLGHGAPIRVRQGHRVRDMEDGAGICSLGSWTPVKRRLPDIGALAEGVASAMKMDEEDWDRNLMAMMAGKQKANPFSSEEVSRGKAFLKAWLTEQGHPPAAAAGDILQGPDLRLLQAFLRRCEDLDAEALDAFCRGVRLGYKAQMPRTLAVFNAKAKWRLKYEPGDSPADPWAPNYKTARENAAFLRGKINEDLASVRMIKMTHKEAKDKYGERLLLGAMGVVEEGADKFRLIHDGSHHTLINHRIRARDHIPGPLVGDIAAMMKDAEDAEHKTLGLVWDFTSAHRVIAVHPEDWGLQACTLADLRGIDPEDDVEVYLNTVGTFGFSTAGHWWGRLAAMLIRAGHYFLGHSLACRAMIFADDGKALLPLQHFRRFAKPCLLST